MRIRLVIAMIISVLLCVLTIDYLNPLRAYKNTSLKADRSTSAAPQWKLDDSAQDVFGKLGPPSLYVSENDAGIYDMRGYWGQKDLMIYFWNGKVSGWVEHYAAHNPDDLTVKNYK